jgi:hypothetical protein
MDYHECPAIAQKRRSLRVHPVLYAFCIATSYHTSALLQAVIQCALLATRFFLCTSTAFLPRAYPEYEKTAAKTRWTKNR